MEVKIIKIGSSKGIRIPSKVLKTLNNPDEFKLTVTDLGIFLKPIQKDTRAGWDEAYANSDSCIIDREVKDEN
ncbi:MAG: AbrB/MazE/SpoVT family DNA-binding domain-containing protein [Campylobacteraceae bacterium]|nr:AbrB/MazE/SpoVT family DNA-binding domain-containing protein [Campylobacteraceae bacterium]